jgi:hypothetical protein
MNSDLDYRNICWATLKYILLTVIGNLSVNSPHPGGCMS